MSSFKAKDRISQYEETSNFKLLSRVPLIINVNGRGFSKVTSLLDKPFSKAFAECMYSALIHLVQEIDGAVFAYSYSDDIIIVARNDQGTDTLPWYENSVHKISSAVASMTTLYFNNFATAMDLNTMSDPVFIAKCYNAPNMAEATNIIIQKQQKAIQSSLQLACLYELLKKYHKDDIREMLQDSTTDDKINLLKQECGVDYNDYPLAFRRGAACYRTPTVVSFDGEEKIKNKWALDTSLPIFTKEHAFLQNIFKSGRDIFRVE
jgi:tRNA(His) 5'-end guanylyltransferase